MVSGFLVNGPYALITTAVSADLGSHESLQVRTRLCVGMRVVMCQRPPIATRFLGGPVLHAGALVTNQQQQRGSHQLPHLVADLQSPSTNLFAHRATPRRWPQ